MALYLKNGKQLGVTTQAFLYCWTHVTTGMWYVGSHTALGCNPDDGYICSSKKVKSMIEQNRTEWSRQIIACGEPTDILFLEVKILTQLDAKKDSMSYNMHNGDGKFTTLGTKWTKERRERTIKSMNGVSKPKEFGAKISKVRTGLKFNDEWRKNIGKSSVGRLQNAEARRKNSESNSGFKNSGFVGYYISSIGEVFDSSRKAGQQYNVTRQTIVNWSKNNKNDWTFKPKESV
jgi:hypothetical protein